MPIVNLRDCKVKDQKTNVRGPILEDMKNELTTVNSKKKGRGRLSKANITGSNAGQCKTANPAQSWTEVPVEKAGLRLKRQNNLGKK